MIVSVLEKEIFKDVQFEEDDAVKWCWLDSTTKNQQTGNFLTPISGNVLGSVRTGALPLKKAVPVDKNPIRQCVCSTATSNRNRKCICTTENSRNSWGRNKNYRNEVLTMNYVCLQELEIVLRLYWLSTGNWKSCKNLCFYLEELKLLTILMTQYLRQSQQLKTRWWIVLEMMCDFRMDGY